jgi:hypothetical protein
MNLSTESSARQPARENGPVFVRSEVSFALTVVLSCLVIRPNLESSLLEKSHGQSLNADGHRAAIQQQPGHHTSEK